MGDGQMDVTEFAITLQAVLESSGCNILDFCNFDFAVRVILALVWPNAVWLCAHLHVCAPSSKLYDQDIVTCGCTALGPKKIDNNSCSHLDVSITERLDLDACIAAQLAPHK
jgi:hypothetical protein